MDDRKSVSGNIFNLGGAAIAWSSKKQETVALSSSEIEYVATSSSACQATCLRRILAEIGHGQNEATEIFCDNKAAIMMSRNPTYHSMTKHIQTQIHYIRELVEGIVTLEL